MTETKNQPRDDGRRKPGAEPVGKKAYEPPRVVSHDALEVITGACSPPGIAKQNTGVCQLGQS
jgi:hypothetical protein